MAEGGSHGVRLRECSTEALEHAYTQLDALMNAIRAEQLQILAELDQRDVGRHDGCTNTADWVAMTSRVRTATARTMVHTAQRLRELPAITTVAAQGVLSWDQLVPLTKIATPDSDQEWAGDGPGFAPAALDAIARARRPVSTADALARQRRKSLYWWTDDRLGMVRLSGRLPELEGHTVITALQRLATRCGPRHRRPVGTGPRTPRRRPRRARLHPPRRRRRPRPGLRRRPRPRRHSPAHRRR